MAVVGPAAAGKTTVIHAAVERDPELRPVLNNTSRPPRPDERDGVDYRFQTLTAMRQGMAAGTYVQVAPNVFGALYATAAEDYATTGVALLPVLAEAVPEFRALPFRTLRVVYVLPPGSRIWWNRLVGRGWDQSTLAKRLAEARRSLRFARDEADTLFVINEDLATSVADFVTLARALPWPDRLREDQLRARMIVDDLLREISRGPL